MGEIAEMMLEARARKKESCPECGNRFRMPCAVRDHRRDVHGVAAADPLASP